jgi:branched-chain amino acid transport system ATP-binding protein
VTALLRVCELSAFYDTVPVIEQVSFEIEPGETVAIVGANGAGKSTLLLALAGLVPCVDGSVFLGNADITRLPPERRVRAGISLVPERRAVFAGLSVRDNLLLGAYHRRRDPALAGDLAAMFALFPALAPRARQRAGALSGGEQQMLAIGRGLMARPRLLLLDEPTLGLGPLAIKDVIAKLMTLRRRGVTCLIGEQNARVAMKLADRVLILTRDRLLETHDPDQTTAALGTAYFGSARTFDVPRT